jgi:HD-GYP domain-containing protein (c-di-GMP phosphodiesterase class II)
MKTKLQNSQPLQVKDLAKKVICDGHLYFTTKEGRQFYLLKPGILIEEAFIKKYAISQTTFDYVPVIDSIIHSQFQTLFKELKYLQFEKDLRQKTMETEVFFRETFSRSHHFLSFALACHQEFCAIPRQELIRMHETDIHLFRKSLYSAAMAVMIAMTNDFYHYPMIKDFYNLTFSLDIGLCHDNYSYFVAEACNRENASPGSGKHWLKEQGASALEVSTYLAHPEKSYQFFQNQSGLLAYPELKEIVLYQHELSNGQGFPRGLPKGHVSSWEAVVILASSMIDICDEYTFETNVMSFIKDFKSDKLKEIPVQRVYAKLCLSLDNVQFVKENAG